MVGSARPSPLIWAFNSNSSIEVRPNLKCHDWELIHGTSSPETAPLGCTLKSLWKEIHGISMKHPQQFRAHLSSAQSNQAISSDFESKQRKASGQSSTKNAPWAELSCWRFQTPSYQWSSVIIANSTRYRVGVHLWCTSEIVSVSNNWMRLSRNFGKHWGHGPNAQPQMMNQTCVKTCLKRAILTVKPRLYIHESDRVLQL